MSNQQTHVPDTASCDGEPIMSLDVTNHSDVAAITISGELDLSTAPMLTDLVDRVAADHPDRVVIDMAGVTFFCAAGLTALLRAHNTVSAAGGRLILRAPSRQTQRILTITGTDGVFQLETVVTGRDSLGRTGGSSTRNGGRDRIARQIVMSPLRAVVRVSRRRPGALELHG